MCGLSLHLLDNTLKLLLVPSETPPPQYKSTWNFLIIKIIHFFDVYTLNSRQVLSKIRLCQFYFISEDHQVKGGVLRKSPPFYGM